MHRIAVAAVMASFALSACGDGGDDSEGDGGSASTTLTAAGVEKCFEDAGATVEHTNDTSVEAQEEAFGFAQRFQGSLQGNDFDGFVEADEEAIDEVRGKAEDLLTRLTDTPSDYVLVKNNGMIIFDATTGEPPDSQLKSVAGDCLTG